MSAAKATKATKATNATTASKSAAGGGDRIGRGTRWTEEQVTLLMDAVKGSRTAKDAFEKVAKQLDKSTGTVAQKYYNLQKQAGGAKRRRKAGRRPAGAGATSIGAAAPRSGRGALGSGASSELKVMPVDELVGLATRVKGEIDRRRQELDAASKLLAR